MWTLIEEGGTGPWFDEDPPLHRNSDHPFVIIYLPFDSAHIRPGNRPLVHQVRKRTREGIDKWIQNMYEPVDGMVPKFAKSTEVSYRVFEWGDTQ